VKASSNWFQYVAEPSGDSRTKATHQAGSAICNALQAQSGEAKQGLQQTDEDPEECKY
jgi:hypothetical protein